VLGGGPSGDFSQCLAPESWERLSQLNTGWIAGGLTMRRADGSEFPAEATLSRFEVHGQPFFTLILRNVNDRRELEYLREELLAVEGYGDILGKSDAMRRALQDVQQVAETDSTVLILGETGVGKELFARAIHAGSKRHDQPEFVAGCSRREIPGRLHDRLNVFPIEVPPLRERGDDVVLLAAAFAQKFAKQMGRAVVPFTENCARRLKAYDWPGNVRELQNVIERAGHTAGKRDRSAHHDRTPATRTPKH
jgi:transcriptional regulator with GAF, ATPase, and Fis domain